MTQLEGILLLLGALRRDGVEYRLLGREHYEMKRLEKLVAVSGS